MKNFLQNLLGFPMSPYKKALRKNVQKFHHRAIKKAANDSQRKLWIAAGLAAEDFVTTLLGSEGKDDGELFKQRILNKTMKKKQIRTIICTTLKVYLSALLVTVTNYKEEILTKTGMNEQDFLKSWCSVFDYKQEDMQVFDSILLPAYRRNGLNGLLQETGKMIVNDFYQDSRELTQEEIAPFEGVLLNDVSSLFNYVK